MLDDGVDAPGLGLGQGVPRPREHPGLNLLQLLAPEIHLLGGREADVDLGRGRPRHRCGPAAVAAVSAADRSWALIGGIRLRAPALIGQARPLNTKSSVFEALLSVDSGIPKVSALHIGDET